ncbi:MAG: NAAT family transporter [Deltaproteobacteria bacterium]|nr:NAAT family transporter [Deltaproteobacteria bacterium]
MGDLVSFSLVAFSAIFFIVDPFAVVPVFIAMTQGDSEEKRRAMAKRACIIAGITLLFFAFGGSILFKLLGISIGAFKIAGGVLLLLTALEMLQSRTSATRTSAQEIEEGAGKQDIAVVPLAIPLLSGPGSIATVMVLTAQSERWWEMIPISLSIVLTAALSFLVLRAASFLDRVLGKSGQAIITRVMGLLLAAIAVEFIMNGLKESFPKVLG